MKFLLWLIIILCGVAIMRYRYQIYEFTGDWWWAEKYLWGNGTVHAISLIGALLVFFGTAYPFGVINLSPDADSELRQFAPKTGWQ